MEGEGEVGESKDGCGCRYQGEAQKGSRLYCREFATVGSYLDWYLLVRTDTLWITALSHYSYN